MNKININQYIGKSTGDPITAATWNEVFGEIQVKINQIIDELSNTPENPDTPVVDATEMVINGTTYTTGGTITLPAGADYTISGTLYGKLVFDASTAEFTTAVTNGTATNTNITLNGATIISTDDCGILYKTPESNKGYKDLIVTLASDSYNYVICTKESANTSDQPGAIYSMNNMSICGVGYLACTNKAGHGIRATELTIAGPHIYADTTHDGIHAGRKLYIDDGYFYAKSVNDMFGTSAEGKIYVFGGYFYEASSSSVSGKWFDSKVAGYYAPGVDITSFSSTGMNPLADRYSSTGPEDENGNLYANWSPVKIYATDADAKADTNGEYLNPVVPIQDTPASQDDDDTQSVVGPITSGYGQYEISSTKPFVRISGKITDRLVFSGTFSDGAKIYLDGAYISVNAPYPAIYYEHNKKNIKIVAVADSENVIANMYSEATENDVDAIKSENNAYLEVKNNSHLFITSSLGDGIDGSDVNVTDSKGTLIIRNCGERGIKGNNISIGPNTNANNPSSVEGVVVVKENCVHATPCSALPTTIVDGVENITAGTGYADIFARQGKKYTKGTFSTQAEYLPGVLITGSIGAVIEIDMDNSDHVYYKQLYQCIQLPMVTDQPNTFTPLTNVPSATEEAYLAVYYNEQKINYPGA